MKFIRMFIFLQLLPCIAHADYYLDRISLKTVPEKACSTLFNNTKVILSTCSETKFDTTNRQKETQEYKDYLFFFKTNMDLRPLAERNIPLGMVNSYFKDNKIISVSSYKPLPSEHIFNIQEQISNVILENESTLHQELLDLQAAYEKENIELQSKLRSSLSSRESSLQFQDVIQKIALIKYIQSEESRIQELKRKTQQISADSGRTQNSPLKAQLSIMLKNSIEAALRSK